MDSEWPDRKEALSVIGGCGGEKRQDTAKAGERGEDGFSHTEMKGEQRVREDPYALVT